MMSVALCSGVLGSRMRSVQVRDCRYVKRSIRVAQALGPGPGPAGYLRVGSPTELGQTSGRHRGKASARRPRAGCERCTLTMPGAAVQ